MSKNYYRLTTCVSLFFLAAMVCGQDQISFGQLTITDGLSQNCGISIAQDSTGYLWIATQDGLNKYDGNEFTVYPFIFDDITRPGFSHLGKVYVDRDNTIWSIPSTRIPPGWMLIPVILNPYRLRKMRV